MPVDIPNREVFFSYNFEANYNMPDAPFVANPFKEVYMYMDFLKRLYRKIKLKCAYKLIVFKKSVGPQKVS